MKACACVFSQSWSTFNLGWLLLSSLSLGNNTYMSGPSILSLFSQLSLSAWYFCFSSVQSNCCCVWRLWDGCFPVSVELHSMHAFTFTTFITHIWHICLCKTSLHHQCANLCFLSWFFCCTQGRHHAKKLPSLLVSLFISQWSMGGTTQKQSIILRLKWTWNYCHTIWLRLLEKLNTVEMDEYTAGVVSCFCRHQQLQFQVILAF